MKFVLVNDGRPGLLQEDGVIDISNLARPLRARTRQEARTGWLA